MLDIDAFANAMRQGSVSFLRPLGLRPFEDPAGEIVSFRDDDSVVFPVADGGSRPAFALRLPLDEASSRRWPAQYADLVTTSGVIEGHLPGEITILDVEDMPGIHAALLYDWVPGETITIRVTRARTRQERDQLTDLLWPMADIAEALRLSGMIHADIAPGNIIVRPDGGMTLIDLDRAGYRDAPHDITPRRRPGYRIPRGGGDPVEEDAFGLLVLMTTCAVLADASVPIDHQKAPESSHPMLLFSSWDLMDPRRSRLVREIEGELTPLSSGLLELLVEACSGPSDRIPGHLRDAVRLIRRSVSRPDARDEDAASLAGWTLVHMDILEETELRQAPAPRPRTAARPEAQAGQVPTTASKQAGLPRPLSVVENVTWPEPEDVPPDSRLHGPAVPEMPNSVSGWGERLEAFPAPEERTSATATAEPTSDASDASIEASIAELREIAERGAVLDRPNRRVKRAEQRRQVVATELQEALAHNDRETLVRLAMSGSLAELGESRRSDLLQVVRALAHDALTRAVASDDDGTILAAVDESVFERDADLDATFRERVRLARSREQWTDQLVDAVRDGDGGTCTALMEEPPSGAVDRLPEAVRRYATQLVERDAAARDAHAFIEERDAEGLVRSLGRLVQVSPVWTDHIDVDLVEQVLGIEQIADHLMRRLVQGPVPTSDQWMVDMVIAAGLLPEVTRRAGLPPREVDERVNGEMDDVWD